MKIWLTADTHFRHGNVIRYNQRPFSSVSKYGQRPDRELECSSPNKRHYLSSRRFYPLGKKLAEHYFSRLNGRIHIVPGGHDRRWNKNYEFFSRSGHAVVVHHPLLTIKVPLLNSAQQQLIVLCHYSMRVWDRSHYGPLAQLAEQLTLNQVEGVSKDSGGGNIVHYVRDLGKKGLVLSIVSIVSTLFAPKLHPESPQTTSRRLDLSSNTV